MKNENVGGALTPTPTTTQQVVVSDNKKLFGFVAKARRSIGKDSEITDLTVQDFIESLESELYFEKDDFKIFNFGSKKKGSAFDLGRDSASNSEGESGDLFSVGEVDGRIDQFKESIKKFLESVLSLIKRERKNEVIENLEAVENALMKSSEKGQTSIIESVESFKDFMFGMKLFSKDCFVFDEKTQIPVKPRWGGIASLLSRKFKIVYDRKDTKEFFYFDPSEGIYKMDLDIMEIRRRINSLSCRGVMMDAFLSSHGKKELVNQLELKAPLLGRADFPKIPENCFALKNCYVDFSKPLDPKFLPLSEKMFFTSKSPIEYDPEAKCPLWDKFTSEVTNPPFDKTLNEIAGYSLVDGNKLQRFFMLIGASGAGKGTYTSLLESLVGDGNTSAMPINNIATGRFDAGHIYGKKLNITFEANPDKALRNIEFVKSATGEDTLTSDRKFKDPFSFKFRGKFLISGNRYPLIPDLDVQNSAEAVARRLVTVDFPRRISDDKKDEDLSEKLKTELSGILNQALEGLKRIFTTKKFTGELSIPEKIEMLKQETDPLYAFVTQCCEPANDGNSFISKQEFYEKYCQFCGGSRKIASKIDVGRKLLQVVSQIDEWAELDENSQLSESYPVVDKIRVHSWQNIKFKDSIQTETNKEPRTELDAYDEGQGGDSIPIAERHEVVQPKSPPAPDIHKKEKSKKAEKVPVTAETFEFHLNQLEGVRKALFEMVKTEGINTRSEVLLESEKRGIGLSTAEMLLDDLISKGYLIEPKSGGKLEVV